MSFSRRFFRSRSTRNVLEVLAWVPVGIFFTTNCYALATVTGASMQPTFNPDLSKDGTRNDTVILEKWSVALNRFKRGEVVTLWSPQNPNLLTTKRIVALENDIVTPLPPYPPTPIRIPSGHCWVEGDSVPSNTTTDSNTYGPVPLGLVNAKVKFIMWPYNRVCAVADSPGKSHGRVQRFEESFPM